MTKRNNTFAVPGFSIVIPILAGALGAALALLVPVALGELDYNRTRFTIWVCLALSAPALVMMILRTCPRDAANPVMTWRTDQKLWWSLGLAAYAVHLWYGFGVMMAGKAANALALQGAVVAIANFALAGLWAVSVAAAWLSWRRLAWVHFAAAILLVVTATGSTLVFGRPPSPLIGGLFLAALAAALIRVSIKQKEKARA